MSWLAIKDETDAIVFATLTLLTGWLAWLTWPASHELISGVVRVFA